MLQLNRNTGFHLPFSTGGMSIRVAEDPAGVMLVVVVGQLLGMKAAEWAPQHHGLSTVEWLIL